MATVEIDPLPDEWRSEQHDAFMRAVNLANCLATELDGVDLPASDRMRAVGAAWWVALEHHAGIVLLVRFGKLASAFALLRPEIDSYLRGLWLASSATDAEVSGFLSGDSAPGSEKLSHRLEAEGILDPDSLTAIQREMWCAVCDYTHTGCRQIVRHLTDSTVESAHDPEEIVELLSCANAWALMAAIGVASAGQLDAKCEQLLELAKRIADAGHG